jgi:hypothetical protein
MHYYSIYLGYNIMKYERNPMIETKVMGVVVGLWLKIAISPKSPDGGLKLKIHCRIDPI